MIVANQRLSAHLIYSEVRCKCGRRCDGGHLRWEVVYFFELIRKHCSNFLDRDCPLYVTSGVRCDPWNIQVGGTQDSYHTKGLAIDILSPEGIGLDEFHRICDMVIGVEGGVGKYHSWKNRKGDTVGGCHIDARGSKARWEVRK